MTSKDSWFSDSRDVGMACAVAAAGLGLIYLSAAGAPIRYLGINAGAVALGLATVALLSRLGVGARRPHGYFMLAAGAALLTTALFGISVDGATRWVGFGPLTVQVSLLLVPAMIVAFARHRNATATVGLCLAACALALQPDRAMAGVSAGGLLLIALVRPDRWSVGASIAAVSAFAVTIFRADALPAVPFVDQIFYSAFAIHGLAGAAVVGGASLLLVSAVVGFVSDPENRLVHATFGATWLGVIAAAALGNYPTPVVGYGGSAILGYLLSVSFMPGRARSMKGRADHASNGERNHEGGMLPRVRAPITAL